MSDKSNDPAPAKVIEKTKEELKSDKPKAEPKARVNPDHLTLGEIIKGLKGNDKYMRQDGVVMTAIDGNVVHGTKPMKVAKRGKDNKPIKKDDGKFVMETIKEDVSFLIYDINKPEILKTIKKVS